MEDQHNEREGCGGNAAPYVLGALTDAEHQAFVVHLESCSVCREEVAALQVVAAALPAAAPQVSAPADLKRRVMAEVREDARRQASQSAASRAELSGARARPWGSRLAAPAWLSWRPNLAVAALAAAVVVLAVVALSSGGDGAGTGVRVIRAQVLPSHARATLNVSDGQAQLSIARMPQTAPGHVYELWLKRSAAGPAIPTDALFTVDAAGAASVGVPGGVRHVSEVMVTSEPLGGSRVPTLPALIVARVA
ncbi:MAG TPA: anti-sigma factor [Solirubrobacteraceae bacterium]|nr:anti-sigma factor [Solirubrobacteraceae bacterium]